MSEAMNDLTAKVEAKKVLMARARQINMEVDKRWSLETLSEKLELALLEHEEEEAEALRQSCDTWVYAIRDCFIATEKMKTGSVFEAPKALYMAWKANGAARLADDEEIAGAKEAA